MSDTRHLPAAPASSASYRGGDVIDRHFHDDHQLIYVSSGVLAITTRHGSWVASSDRALWVPAGVWHEHRFYGRSEFHTIGFPAGGTPLLPAGSPTAIAVGTLLRELLVALTGAGLSRAEAGRIRAVVRDQLHRAAVQPVMLPTPSDPRLADACQIAEADLRLPRSLAWLARRVNTSERTLSRLFRAEFGMSYPQWRTRTRIFAALVLLADDATVTDTAHACGWATTSAFVHAFAKAMGTTPGAHRAGGRQAVLPAHGDPAPPLAVPPGPGSDVIDTETNPAAAKRVLAQAGLIGSGFVRAPLVPLTEAGQATARRLLAAGAPVPDDRVVKVAG
jgi:AraC-like DNA-binding protein